MDPTTVASPVASVASNWSKWAVVGLVTGGLLLVVAVVLYFIFRKKSDKK